MSSKSQTTRTRLHSCDNAYAVIMRLSCPSESGKTLETHQVTYVTNNAHKFFLSREAPTELGLISFPTAGETTAHLQQWLLYYYRSSTFNTCEHQPLSLMDGLPMRLMIDPDAEPKAHHTPIPVLPHWRAYVKAGLDQDVALGVLEPVPVSDPVTVCHRRWYTPKRTEGLNAQCTFKPSTSMPQGESTIHKAYSTKYAPSRATRKSASSIAGMDTIVFLSTKMTEISPRSSHHGNATETKQIHRVISRRGTDIPDVSTKSSRTYPISLKSLTITLLWADNLTASFHEAFNWLDICGRHGITLNRENFVFG